jgi:thiosulfate reductase cytochrome b subunit
MSERIYVFKRFERFWHWSQAALIIFLMLTAFDIHGTYTIFGFEKAVAYHTTAAWTLIGLWVFAIFWHFTTGEWKQYIPTTEKVVAMMKYYLVGIFKNAPHPFKLTTLRKHNPLQRLAYLFILVCVDLRCCGSPAGSTCSTTSGRPGVSAGCRWNGSPSAIPSAPS